MGKIRNGKRNVSRIACAGWSLTFLTLGLAASGQGWQLATNLALKADFTLKETFDSNVYLQDVEPSLLATNAARPFQESLVTSATPRLALDWKPSPEFNVALNYAPEVVTFHQETSESHVAHRAALTFSGKVHAVTWEQFNTLTWIDGSQEGLTFGGPGGAPSIGGIPIRDRRAALVYRNGFRAFHPHGNWFFRPVAWSYIHDFYTQTHNPDIYKYYQNYVDRNDFTVGMDTGYRAFKNAHLVVGYRYGFQQEPALPGKTNHYSNNYHRFVLGLEGKLTDWLKITGVVGPDYRDFCCEVPAGFDDHHTALYYDATIALTPTKQDTITLAARQFEQPAFGTPSVYEDITWEINWRHQFDAKLALTTGFRAYGGDWLPPVLRDDWIYTPSVCLSYVPNRHVSGELSYGYDWSKSYIANTAGREFTRHLVSLSLKYAF